MADGLDVSVTPGLSEDPENRNRIAVRARSVFFWALGVVVVFWLIPMALTFVPSSELQTVAIMTSWVGFLPAIALSILSIVFGSLGLSRAQKLGGYRRGSALTGLIGGIGLLATLALVTILGFVLILVLSSV